MTGAGVYRLVGVAVLLWGCSGRLQFDPRQHDAAAPMPGAGSPAPGVRPAADAGAPAETGPTGAGGGGEYDPPPPTGALPASDAGPPADHRPSPDALPASDSGLPGDAGSAGDALPSGDALAAADTMPPAAAVCPPGFDVLESVFKKNCSTCHGAASPARNLDLVSPGLAERLVGRPSGCNGQPLIARVPSGDPLTGMLFDKLAGAVADCGVQMPAGAAPLSEAEMACVKEWAVQSINTVSGGN
jgi:hypothetical protein